jgi:hypothetical protein
MAELSSKGRKALPKSNFALPAGAGDSKKPAYPVQDKGHAVAALARVAKNGTPAEKAAVRGAVKKKFPDLPSSKGKGQSAAAAHNRKVTRRAGGKKAG